MKKQLVFISLFAFLCGEVSAQVPQGIKYQGVARNAAGTVLGSQALIVRLSVHDINPTGTVIYRETHNVTTNQFGLYNATIGQGAVLTGVFSSIAWGTGNKYIEQEVDFGSGFVSMGTSQFMSVPYALYSSGGPAGPAGPQGVAGPQGPQGPQGLQGTPGTNGNSWTLTTPTFSTNGQLVVNGTVGSGGPLTTTSAAWLTGGNALTATGSFGTSSNNHIDIVTNNIGRGRFTNGGQLVFGATTPPFTNELAAFVANSTQSFAVSAHVGSGVNGVAVYGDIQAGNSAALPAVVGEYMGSGLGNGVQGYYGGTATGVTRTGVIGYCDGATNVNGGVGAYGFNGVAGGTQRIGILGNYNSANAYGMGVVGLGPGGTIPTGNNDLAVMGWVTNNANYAGYFNGNHVVSNGTKSGSVPTSKGNQLLYVMESPEVWFEDIGGGTLVSGEATIQMDPLFLETVVIDAQHKMRVFIQMEGESEEVFVTPGTTSFKVKERNNGSSNAAFSYRVMAKRVHFQDHRFGNDPVWGAGDTRQYSEYSQPPLIDYSANLQLQEEKKRNAGQKPLPAGFITSEQIQKEATQSRVKK